MIGGGNAGLVAALTARRRARRVLLLDRAPAALRGGNTRHTRNIRCVHDEADAYQGGSYPFGELWADLCGVGTGPANEKLAELTVRESRTVPPWMSDHGIRWQRPLAGTLHLGRTNRFFLGGGKALVNAYHRTAARMGIETRYGTTVTGLVMDGDWCTGLVTEQGPIAARAVVCASGGFEANLAWLAPVLGRRGRQLHHPRHAVQRRPRAGRAVRARGRARPATTGIPRRRRRRSGPAIRRRHRHPPGLDPLRHRRQHSRPALLRRGRGILAEALRDLGSQHRRQPEQIAYSIWDAKVDGCSCPRCTAPTQAASIGGSRRRSGSTRRAWRDGRANSTPRSAGRTSTRQPGRLPHEGLQPPKSHWAQPIDTPPFYGDRSCGRHHLHLPGRRRRPSRPVCCCTDGRASATSSPLARSCPATSCGTGYLAGFGLTIGTRLGPHRRQGGRGRWPS